MLRFTSQFIKPNKLLRELSALMAIDENPRISQCQIAALIGTSRSMANNYVKELVRRETVHMEGESNRDISYYLTAKGKERKTALLISSSIEVIQLYTRIKKEFELRLMKFYQEGSRHVALYGAAETGEVVYAASIGTPICVEAVVDGDPAKHGARFWNLTVQPARILPLLEGTIDSVIVTSIAHSDEIVGRIQEILPNGIAIKKL